MADDTIAAVATPPGRGGVGVLRVSGPLAAAIATALCGSPPPPRHACLRHFTDAHGDVIDQGLALFFPGPRSFTGEDVLELQAHGSPAVLEALLQAAQAAGARLARPGEFTERAFLNDKLDLAQAEAVADLIDAGSLQAARAAARALQGRFSREVDGLSAALVALRVFVEAAIDFPDEDGVAWLEQAALQARLADARHRLDSLRQRAGQGAALREGLKIAIAGAPNVGKSSLLNRLTRADTAIVTAIPGTTRDVLRQTIDLDGLPLHLADTAGLRATEDPIEAEGVARARAELAQADCVLLVVDDREPDPPEPAAAAGIPPGPRVIVLRNKCDLSGAPAGAQAGDLRISALTGAGFDALAARLRGLAGLDAAEPEFMARRRHLTALDAAAASLNQAAQCLADGAGELLAEELRAAHDALGAITGRYTSDDLLGEIFASFCIGK